MLSQNIHKVCAFKKAKVDKDRSNHHFLATFMQLLMDDFAAWGSALQFRQQKLLQSSANPHVAATATIFQTPNRTSWGILPKTPVFSLSLGALSWGRAASLLCS
jgi:hypothetical protein